MKDAGTDAGTAKIISARLTNSLSTRTSCLIIIMVMIMPMFTMFSYPESDMSITSWLTNLDNIASRSPSRLQEQLNMFSKFYQKSGIGGSGGYYPWKCIARD